MSNSTSLRVALLTGGDSSERSVAFSSAQSVVAALHPEKFSVSLFDVASSATHAAQQSYDFSQPCASVTWDALTTTLHQGGFDVVYPVLHGGWGEDGTLQALLEVAGVPYVGSGPRASAVAMDKQICKAFARELGIPVPRGAIFDSVNEVTADALFPGPLVVKPRGGGSSVGVTLLRERQGNDLNAVLPAVELALRDGNGVLIEELIDGTEISCPVLGAGETAYALPAIEIVPQLGEGFYDFEAKYAAGGSQHLIPPRLPQAALDAAADYTLRIYRALGCKGTARADFMVCDGVPCFLEINTLPGMTSTSLVPDAARAVGIEFPQLLETLIQSALRPV